MKLSQMYHGMLVFGMFVLCARIFQDVFHLSWPMFGIMVLSEVCVYLAVKA